MSMTFDQAVEKIAEEAGVAVLLTIPGVWECIQEAYNNDAMSLMQEDQEDDEEDEPLHWCPDDDDTPCVDDCPYREEWEKDQEEE